MRLITPHLRKIILTTLTMMIAQGCSTCEPMAEDYDRSCQVDTDCQVVYLHRDCDCGDITAVNKSEISKVRADNEDARSTEWCPTGKTQCDVAPMEAYCDGGTCQARVVEGF